MKSPFLKFLVVGLFISFFACGDSPLDAVEDLFIFDRTGDKILTFIKSGNDCDHLLQVLTKRKYHKFFKSRCI